MSNKFALRELPYGLADLEPYISKRTVSFHYEKHHKGYLNNLNSLITEDHPTNLEDLIRWSHEHEDTAIFNNAAQVWNHDFYWQSVKPSGGGNPVEDLLTIITEDFGSFEEFKKEFLKTGLSQFGSGWVWLVLKNGKLTTLKTPNADLPFLHGATPLLTCDVWEHSYYLDYQNRRTDYLQTFLEHLANWDFARHNLEKASSSRI